MSQKKSDSFGYRVKHNGILFHQNLELIWNNLYFSLIWFGEKDEIN